MNSFIFFVNLLLQVLNFFLEYSKSILIEFIMFLKIKWFLLIQTSNNFKEVFIRIIFMSINFCSFSLNSSMFLHYFIRHIMKNDFIIWTIYVVFFRCLHWLKFEWMRKNYVIFMEWGFKLDFDDYIEFSPSLFNDMKIIVLCDSHWVFKTFVQNKSHRFKNVTERIVIEIL